MIDTERKNNEGNRWGTEGDRLVCVGAGLER